MDEELQELQAWGIIFLVCLLAIGLPVAGYTVYTFRNAGPWLPLLPVFIVHVYWPQILSIAIAAAVIATGVWVLRRKWKRYREHVRGPRP